MASLSKTVCKAKTKVLTKTEHKNLVTLIKRNKYQFITRFIIRKGLWSSTANLIRFYCIEEIHKHIVQGKKISL